MSTRQRGPARQDRRDGETGMVYRNSAADAAMRNGSEKKAPMGRFLSEGGQSPSTV